MKSCVLIFLIGIMSSVASASDFTDELSQIRPRISYLNLSTSVEGQVGEVKTSFAGIGVAGLYDFKLLDEQFYAGLEWSSFKNKSDLSWSNLKIVGGWKFTPPTPWIITPFVETGLGIGSFDEKGGSFKISDHKGRVLSLELGGESTLGSLWDKISGLTVHGSYLVFHSQSHDAFAQTGPTSFKSQGFRLSISYDF